jgi:cation transport regulator
MPYASIEELPPSVARHLPTHAQEIYRAAFNHAWKGRGRLDEARAHRIAWAAVKRKFRKLGDLWLPIDAPADRAR